MNKHPLYNAGAAFLYIVAVVSFIRMVGILAGDKPDNTFLAPIGALSLLVLSVSMMAYVFFSTPLTLLLKGEDKAGIRYLLHTVGYFALFVIAAFLMILGRQ